MSRRSHQPPLARKLRLEWDTITAAVVDKDGDIYCLGHRSIGRKTQLWRMSPDLQPVWVTYFDGYDHNDAQLALDARDQLFVVARGTPHVSVRSAADGSQLRIMGGKEPSDATIHHFDMSDCIGFYACADCSFLARLGKFLVRYDSEGNGIATWPMHTGFFGLGKQRLRPLYGPGGSFEKYRWGTDDIPTLRSYPIRVREYQAICMSPEDTLYLVVPPHVHALDPRGRRIYRKRLGDVNVGNNQAGVDNSGRLYALASLPSDPPTRVLLRISARGHKVETLARDRSVGGVIGDDELLVVSPEGKSYLFGPEMSVVILDAEGAVLRDDASLVAAKPPVAAAQIDVPKATGPTRNDILLRTTWAMMMLGGIGTAIAVYLYRESGQSAAIIGGLPFAGAVIALLVFNSLLEVCPADVVAVLSGRQHTGADGSTRDYRILRSGWKVRWPFAETRSELSLRSLSVGGNMNARSRDGTQIELEYYADIRLSSEEPAVHCAIDRFLGKSAGDVEAAADEIVQSNLRALATELTLEELRDDDRAAANASGPIKLALHSIGIDLESIEILNASEA